MRRPVSRFASLVGAFALAVPLAACSSDLAGGPVPADAIAVVNGDSIPLDVFAGTIAELETADETAEAPTGVELEALERDVASVLVQSRLISQLGEELDIAPTQDDLDEAWDAEPGVAEQAEQYGMDRDQFQEWLVTPNLVVQRLPEVLVDDVDDEAVQAAFEERTAAGNVVGTVSHILVATRREARDVLGRLDDGEDFAAVATETSLDQGSAANGGSLGVDQPLSTYVGEFAEAATNAPIGEVVGPVQTEFGFHLIRVDDRRELVLDDLREELRSEAAQGLVQTAVFDAYAEADVNVTSRLGVWDGETGSVVADEPAGGATDGSATEDVGN